MEKKRQREGTMTEDSDDPYHHLHDEAYAIPFEKGRVDAEHMIAMAGRTAISLDGNWNFVLDLYDEGLRQAWYKNDHTPIGQWITPRDYDGGIWQHAPVPSCWNVLKPEWFYFEGSGWYARSFALDKISDHQAYFLRFGAANYEARIFVNSEFVGSHRGGSTPFFIDISHAIHQGENNLFVQVENRRRSERVPMHHTDWFNYGGLYRETSLLALPKCHINDFGLFLKKETGHNIIHVDITVSEAVSGEALLDIPELGVRQSIVITQGHGYTTIAAHPELWEPDHPKLYAVTLAFGTDQVSDHIGFRIIETKGDRIFLNGKDIFLRGICVHEDDKLLGKTSSESDIRQRFAHAKELGCNYLRLSHYPHHEKAAQIADEMGLLLWEEIPVYWAIEFDNPDTYQDAENQLKELIRRDRNRASVIIWGVGNENADTDQRLSFMGRLAKCAHEIDSSRLVSAACLINREKFAIEDRLADFLDIIGINEYFGWYEPSFDGLRKLLHNSNPGKPVIICETGADALSGRIGDEQTLFSEAHQSKIYREQFALLATAPYIRGITPWILYDFRTERRQTSIQQGWNLKGLIASDKTTRKQAFDVVKQYYHQIKNGS
jgi:beta-glucuronidase